jgi:hypothetical protein
MFIQGFRWIFSGFCKLDGISSYSSIACVPPKLSGYVKKS